jgi:hypothetical protein
MGREFYVGRVDTGCNLVGFLEMEEIMCIWILQDG